jgi:hypothetical protein
MYVPVATVQYSIETFFFCGDYSGGISYLLDQMTLKPLLVICTIILVLSASSSKADRKNALSNSLIPIILTFIVLMILHFAAKRIFDVLVLNILAIYIAYLVLTLVIYIFNRLLIALKIF